MGVKPKFFCEFCGTEVRQNDKLCSRCGKFFSSVKCPSCGFSGDSGIFRDGCPACGYAFTGQGPGPNDAGKKKPGAKKKTPAKPSTDPLPWWIYAASLILVLVFILVIALRR